MKLRDIPSAWRSLANGPFPLLTKGEVVGASASGIPLSLASGTHGYALVADNSTETGLNWSAFAGSNYYLDGLSFGSDSKITGSMTGVGDVTSNALTTFTPVTTFTTGAIFGGNATAGGYIKF